MSEVKKLRDDLIKQGDEDYYLKEEVIRLRYENQNLKEENKGLREKLAKAYEFMRKFVIEGNSMLDKFLEWIGEKVRDGRGRYKFLSRWSLCSTLFTNFREKQHIS